MTRYEDMTVEELKDRLRNKGHPVSGVKEELIDRLRGGSVKYNKLVKPTTPKGDKKNKALRVQLRKLKRLTSKK